MKQWLLLLVLLGALVWIYFYFFRSEAAVEPAAVTPSAHLAPPGTFFVLTYVSVPTSHGIIGFEPGREVHFVQVDRAKGRLLVTDGQYQVELQPSQLTNDLDMAAMARKGDQESQQQIHSYIDREEQVYSRFTKARDVEYAKAMERAASGLPTATPGASLSGNNPYSYLYAPH